MTRRPQEFGQLLREKRLAKGVGLRAFAELVGVSPTYLSQVEQCNSVPPTADRVRRMAELLEENADEWMAVAGRISDDLLEIIRQSPVQISGLLREVQGMTEEQLREVREVARNLRKENE
jgi:transcriptional regulator with XRE-family HTH domain